MNTFLKTTFPLLLCVALLSACDRPYSIRGTLPSSGGTDTLWVVCKGPSVPLLQSTVVKNGSFTVEVTNDSVDLVSLISPHIGSVCSFVPVEGERCTVTFGDEQESTIEVEGDESARQYYQFRRDFKNAARERTLLCNYLEELKQADSMALYQTYLLNDTLLTVDRQLTRLTEEFIVQHPHSPYGATALADLLTVTKRYPLTYDLVRAKAHEGATPRSLYNELYRDGQAALFSLKDNPFPEITFRLSDHQFRSINQYKRSAHLLFCFWNPADSYSCFVVKQLSNMEEEYKNHNTTFLFIAISNDYTEWKQTIDRLGLKGTQAIISPVREVDLLTDCGIKQLPYTFFVTREDKVRFENLYASQLTDSLNLFFGVTK